MNTTTFTATAAFVATTGLAMAETTPISPDLNAVLTELEAVAATCAEMGDGQVNEEIFGILMIRIGETCVIINGDEIDPQALEFLEEQKLPWAGVGLWVKATDGTN